MNLYIHFPFCRSKCAYCALFSRAGSNDSIRLAYSQRVSDEIKSLDIPRDEKHTIYFGGGSPALCPLEPVFSALESKDILPQTVEFTVELHPLDVSREYLEFLKQNGVNRISIGVQTFNDAALAYLNRWHTSEEAHAAVVETANLFESTGIDLIVGLQTPPELKSIEAILPFLSHVSVYTLIREPKTLIDKDIRLGKISVPDDASSLAEFSEVRNLLLSNGFRRYEIANFARPGFECKHNLAVWRGEDYTGLGDGAHGRNGFFRTAGSCGKYETEKLSTQSDALERALFSLRTSEGLSLDRIKTEWPVLSHRLQEWDKTLAFHASNGLLEKNDSVYTLTQRGAEVCDSILADLL